MILDVINCLVDKRRTDGKCAIAVLPGKLGIVWRQSLYPLAAFCLRDSEQFTHRLVLWEIRQQMNMVGHTTNSNRNTAFTLQNSTDVCKNLRQIVLPHFNAGGFDVEDDV